ncbi:uncharacterized protein LOC108916758 [Anoplophora glabripennis]|uniref:uncharacterized protein LOC108916758 n=1 Tax=Anoplophora glabripennis TaxID=217634 RepID=UPI000C76844E|nr:uncharacterized protein LOC108916758 [Anoplophora glabripennis]
MKVSIAAQVFSHSVASVMQLLSKVNLPLSENNLDASGSQTAEVLKFFDKLFDSVNGNTLFPKNGKILKCAVSSSSGHVMFWREARNHLKNMYFVNVISKEEMVPPSLKNWIRTLAGMEELLKILKENNITFLGLK